MVQSRNEMSGRKPFKTSKFGREQERVRKQSSKNGLTLLAREYKINWGKELQNYQIHNIYIPGVPKKASLKIWKDICFSLKLTIRP